LLTLVDIHQSKTFNLDIFYLIQIDEMSSQAKKDTRRSIKAAFNKINELDKWEITINSNKTVTIKRN